MTGLAAGIDAVLQVPAPAFSAEQACAIGAAVFGIKAAGARNLGSERDQAFLLTDGSGVGLAVLKVSNPAEDPATLDMEALAAFHASRCDPGLTIALPRRMILSASAVPASPVPDSPGLASRGTVPATGDISGYRAWWPHTDAATGRAASARSVSGYWVRAYDLLPGRARLDPLTLSDQALIAWGETAARLGRALRGFIHPKAIRQLPWDVKNAATARPMLATISDLAARAAVTAVFDRFDDAVLPRLPLLRAQVIHSDLTADNVLADDDGLITGIVDFGDLTHTVLLADLAGVLDSLAGGRPGEEMFRVARLVLDGYERILPLESLERELLGELWATRAALTVAIGAWRVAEGLEEPDFAQRYDASELAMIVAFLTVGWVRTARLLGADPATPEPVTAGPATPEPVTAGPATPEPVTAGPATLDRAIAARRDNVFGPAMEPLSYAEPIEMASASGVWMTDTTGRRYLDMYNNVPCVGHSHPRVTSAVARQWRTLNTNLRYLHHGAVELAERLIATCPPGLDTVLFVNSGSEANDVAWRIARAVTGREGGLCTSYAYHGITEAIADLSPEVLPASAPPGHIATWAPPDAYRGLHGSAEGFAQALRELAGRGFAPAAAILDGVLQSDGVLDPEPGYVQELLALTRAAGGLWIADEVQGGHGRTGEAMWSFQRFGIVPDFVTLGKPMGNGQPVGAVITRRELAGRFAGGTTFFSTFGGNQVSMAAAHAVLDVLDDERVLPRVREAGAELRAAIRTAAEGYPEVGDVRGVGLACGIELVADPVSKEPDPATATAIKEALRRRGVLVGTTGQAGNVLKVRPPLAFTVALVPEFTHALAGALREVAGR